MKSSAVTVTPVRINKTWYYVHAKRVPEGVEGYVVHDGEFVCLVPRQRNDRELLAEAERQIRRASGNESRS